MVRLHVFILSFLKQAYTVRNYFIFSVMSQDTPSPPDSGQLQYDYSVGNSYGGSYGEDDAKDSRWIERQNR